MNEFDNWYKGDLIYDEICDECIPPEMLRKWMMACWNAALEAAQNEDAITFDLHAYDVLESLKEKI